MLFGQIQIQDVIIISKLTQKSSLDCIMFLGSAIHVLAKPSAIPWTVMMTDALAKTSMADL